MRQPRIFHLLQRAHGVLFKAANRALKKHAGLSSPEQAILYLLASDNGAPITQIAEKLQLGNSNLTAIVTRMEEKQLVIRRQSAADARSYEVFIQPAGRSLVEQLLPGTRAINRALLEPFDAEERAVIERFLKHMAENAADIIETQTQRTFEPTANTTDKRIQK